VALEIGSLLRDRYRIDEVLAQGGMGAIYRAFDVSLNIVVAVKENLFASEESSRQFQAEARILANLRHPNLPRVTDHFVIAGQGQYLVMDFIPGLDLKEIIVRDGAIREDDAIRVAKSACSALEYLHSCKPPIIHRDIKPGNIKITPDNEVFLVDFGLAKQAEVGESTMTGAQALTPGFAPPEQYGQGTDIRSDIYSLGATIYAAITVDSPPDGLTRVVSPDTKIAIRTKNASISTGLEAVIQKAMAVSPLERYQTAREFRAALTELENSKMADVQHSTDATVMTPRVAVPVAKGESRQIQPKPKPKGWIFAILGAILLAVIVGGIVLATSLLRPKEGVVAEVNDPTQTIAAAATFTQVVEEEAEAVVEETELPNEAVAPSLTPTELPAATDTPQAEALSTPVGGGSGMIAFASDRSGVPQIYLLDLTTREITQLTEFGDGACQPDWSPDGQQIVLTSPCAKEQVDYQGSRLYIVNVDGSGLFPLNTLPGGDYDPAWNPVNADLIAFTSYRNDNRPHLFVYNLADKSVSELSTINSYDRSPVWSPDGTTLAFQTVFNGSNQIFTMTIDDLKRKEISKSTLESTMPAWSHDGALIYYSQGAGLPGLAGRQVDNLQASEFTLVEPKPVWGLNFSTDDFWLTYFGISASGQRDIFVMLSSGGMVENLTNDDAFDFDPKWRP